MKKKILSVVGIALTCMVLMTGCQQKYSKIFRRRYGFDIRPWTETRADYMERRFIMVSDSSNEKR